MLRLCGRFVAGPLALILAVAAVQPARAEKPVAVVSVKSFDALLGDFKYLMTLAGQGDMANQVDGIINAATGGQGLAGFDTKRPFGAMLPMPKDFHGEPPALVFLPVTKQEEFLTFLGQINFPAEKADGGLFKVNTPAIPVYLRFAHRHVFVSNKEDVLKGELPDPATVLTGAHKDSLLAASINLGVVPRELKQMVIQHMDQELKREAGRGAGRPGFEREAQEAGMKLAREYVVRLIEDSEEVALSANVDQKQHRLVADLALKAKPGSPLAQGFQSFGAGRSMFSGLAQDAAANLLVRVAVPEELRKMQKKIYDLAINEALQKEPDAKKKALAERVLKTLEPTLLSGVVDYGAALRGPLADKKYVIIGAIQVKEGKKIEQLLRDLLKEIPPRERERVKITELSHGGANIHVVTFPGAPVDAKAKEIIGEPRVHVAFRDDALFVSVGEHGLEVIKQAIDQAGKTSSAATATAPMQLEASVARLMTLVPENREKIAAAVQKVFSGADKDKDRIRLSVQGGDALRLRLELSTVLVKLAAELAPQFGR